MPLRNKKTQVTVFIIIGIIVIVLSSLFFYNISSSYEDDFDNKLDELTNTIQKSEEVNRLIDQCLSSVSLSATRRILSQGGFYFSEQNGSMIDWEIEKVEVGNGINKLNVTYQIFGVNEKVISAEPRYPCYLFNDITQYFPDYMKGDICHSSYSYDVVGLKYGQWGEEGKNKFRPALLSGPVQIGNISYGLYDYKHTNYHYSIEEQLENYILTYIPQCITFEGIEGYNRTFQADIKNMSVDVHFGNQDMVVDLYVPVLFSLGPEKDAFIKKFKYSVTHDVRVKNMYDIFGRILDGEVNDIRYRIDEVNSLYPDFDIKRILLPNYDSIVIINDTLSRINGQEVYFQFANKNRRPVLAHIGEGNPPNPYPEKYDIYVLENETIRIAPHALDPDENQLLYSFSGWKVDWDDKYFPVLGLHSYGVLNYGNKWESSSVFKETKRVAEINVTKEDHGEHNVTVYVQDQQGLRDFQVIKIYVDDKPVPRAYINNPYDSFGLNLPKAYASIEDFLIMDATKTVPLDSTEIYEHKWVDKTDESLLMTDWMTINKVLMFPSLGKDVDIKEKILAGGFTKEDMAKSPHEIEYSVRKQGVIGSESKMMFSVEIKQCLPYRADSAPWPFSQIPDEEGYVRDVYPFSDSGPYYANHTCCTESFGPATSNVNCYSLNDYGCRTNFKNATSVYSRPVQPSFADTDLGIANGYDAPKMNDLNDNDVYKREFNRNCDGVRGNTCTGPVTDNYVVPLRATGVAESGSEDGIFNCFDGPDGVCNHCGYGFSSCVNESGTANVACNDEIRCVSGPGGETTYNSSLGSWACSGACNTYGRCWRADPLNCVDCSATGRICQSGVGCV